MKTSPCITIEDQGQKGKQKDGALRQFEVSDGTGKGGGVICRLWHYPFHFFAT